MRHPIRTLLLALAGFALATTALPAASEPSHLQRTFGDSPDVGYLWTPPAKAKHHFRGINPRGDHRPGLHPRHHHGAKGIRVPHYHAHKVQRAHNRCVVEKRGFEGGKRTVTKHPRRCDVRQVAPTQLHKPQVDLPKAAHKWHREKGFAHKVHPAGKVRGPMPCGGGASGSAGADGQAKP